MALSATTTFYAQSTGDDVNNGGAFDPGTTAGMLTDGAATVANTAAPVFTSASYNFVAGDVGAWVYIASGTNWTPGWYIIVSVAANAATINGTIGAAILPGHLLSTVVGCATVASPTAATWSIDYSRQTTAEFTYTDLASAGAGLTVSSALLPFAKQQVGNALIITGGTNFTAGTYVIASVAAGVATVVGAANITTGIGALGTGGLGGCCATPGKACGLMVSGNDLLIQGAAGTHLLTSATPNIAGGMLTPPAGTTANPTRVVGFNLLPGDNGTKPLLQASGAIATFAMITITGGVRVENLSFDGVAKTSSRGVGGSGAAAIYRCKFANMTNSACTGSAATHFWFCEMTGCSTIAAAVSGTYYFCAGYANTVTVFSLTGSFAYGCFAVNNTGGSTDGFLMSTSSACENCTAYNNGRHGFIYTTSAAICTFTNCVAVNNTGYGFTTSAASGNLTLLDCGGFNNTSGLVNTTNVEAFCIINLITLTGDPFINAAGLNFGLNSVVGAGAALKGQGVPTSSGVYALPGLSTPSAPDVGGAQGSSAGGGGGQIIRMG